MVGFIFYNPLKQNKLDMKTEFIDLYKLQKKNTKILAIMFFFSIYNDIIILGQNLYFFTKI